MKHRFTLFALAAAILSTGAWADVLTPGQALARLGEGRAKAPSAGSPATLKLRATVNTSAAEPAAYLFEKEGQKGYVVLAADDGVDAVLGYSDAPIAAEGTIPPRCRGCSTTTPSKSRHFAQGTFARLSPRRHPRPSALQSPR